MNDRFHKDYGKRAEHDRNPNSLAYELQHLGVRRLASMRRTYRGPQFYRFLPFFLIFFAVPYLFDLVYCEDLSAPPLLLAMLVDGEEVDPSEASEGPFSSNDQATSVDFTLGVVVAYSQPICQTQAIGYLQHLSLASLTSRPPPVL